MICFQDIPHHIFQYMQDYLQTKLADYINYDFGKKNNYYDDKYWRNFMNTCKTLQEVKQVTIYLKLNIKYSKQFISDESFRDLVLQRVKHPSRQIGLDLVNYKEDFNELAVINGVNFVDLSFSDIQSADMLHDITHLLLLDCTDLAEPPSLTRVHTLNLSSCKSITNDHIRSLGNVPYLDLSWCESISDVSCLGGNHTLKLRGCKHIVDVSMLGRVHSLDLTGCTAIKDVSALGKVHDLSIAKCDLVTDLTALSEVKSLDISELSVKSVAVLTGLRSLRAVRCHELKSLAGIEEVEELEISGSTTNFILTCSKLKSLTIGSTFDYNDNPRDSPVDISSLTQLKNLTIRGSNNIVGVGNLPSLETLHVTNEFAKYVNAPLSKTCKKVILSNCYDADSLSDYFVAVKEAVVQGSYYFKSPHIFKGVERLSISVCSEVAFVAQLKCLVDLTVIDCSSFKNIDFATLPNLETVFLEMLSSLKSLDVAGSKLRSITVTKSSNLKTLTVTKPVQSVRLIDCNSRVKISVEAYVNELILVTQDRNYKLKVANKKGKIDNLVVDIDEE